MVYNKINQNNKGIIEPCVNLTVNTGSMIIPAVFDRALRLKGVLINKFLAKISTSRHTLIIAKSNLFATPKAYY